MSKADLPTDSNDLIQPIRKSGTLLVLLMLVFAAAMFSYLIAYAIPEALIAANVVGRWADGSDPRPRRLGVTFAAVMGLFLMLATTARFVSSRQMRRIDAMSAE